MSFPDPASLVRCIQNSFDLLRGLNYKIVLDGSFIWIVETSPSDCPDPECFSGTSYIVDYKE